MNSSRTGRKVREKLAKNCVITTFCVRFFDRFRLVLQSTEHDKFLFGLWDHDSDS